MIIPSIRDHARNRGFKLCIAGGSWKLDYRDVWLRTLAARSFLLQKGVEPGDRVLLSPDRSGIAFSIAYLATHLSGAIAVPLDEKSPEDMWVTVAEQVNPRLVLRAKDLSEMLSSLQLELGGEEAGELPDPDSIADIIFTSGTTGKAKGVTLTHGNIAAAAANINAFIGNSEHDCEVVTVPLFHSFGLGRLRCIIVAGGSAIFVPGLAFPATVFEALEAEGVTGLSCVPTGLKLLKKWNEARLAACGEKLAYVELGSSAMAEEAKREVAALLPKTRICMHYGLTEASRSTFLEFHADSPYLDSVGRPSPNVEMSIRQQGRECDPGEVGEIHIRAASVMKGYWGDAKATAVALSEDGWFASGDVGFMDAAGYVYFLGREDDLINVGGKKVDPVAVEEAVLELEWVADAACVGMVDPKGLLGQVPALFVVCKPETFDEAALRTAVSARVAAHANPREVFRVNSLARTASGKLKRAELRKRLESGAGQSNIHSRTPETHSLGDDRQA